MIYKNDWDDQHRYLAGEIFKKEEKMNDIDEKEKFLRILQNSQAGLKRKTVVEKVGSQVTSKDSDLIQIDTDSCLDEGGGIKEVDIFNIKVFACGCKVDGRSNFGGIDYKGNIVCSRHYYRCIRCRRPLSTLTVKPIKGYCYCARCARIVKFLKFLGLKK
jgi:hypothetical protein